MRDKAQIIEDKSLLATFNSVIEKINLNSPAEQEVDGFLVTVSQTKYYVMFGYLYTSQYYFLSPLGYWLEWGHDSKDRDVDFPSMNDLKNAIRTFSRQFQEEEW